MDKLYAVICDNDWEANIDGYWNQEGFRYIVAVCTSKSDALENIRKAVDYISNRIMAEHNEIERTDVLNDGWRYEIYQKDDEFDLTSSDHWTIYCKEFGPNQFDEKEL